MDSIITEEWRNIEGYKGLYQVSNLGRVKSLPKARTSPKGSRYVRSSVILKGFDNRGYRYVILYKDGKGHSKKIHRLVAEAFIPNPYNLSDVNHIDYNRANNVVTNLEWISKADNLKYSVCRQPKNRIYKTKSGEPYISMRRKRYRVCITKYRIDKEFDLLEDAISYRNERLKEYDYRI